MNENYLDEKEQAAVIAFNGNKTMVDAVRKVLLATVFHQGTVVAGENPTPYNFAFNIVNETKSDEQLGQELRASVAALGYIKSGFERLSEIKRVEEVKKKINRAL